MDNKVMICGAAGTGKTTLAKEISELFKLPYIRTSAGDLWPEYGFKDHQDSIKKCQADINLGFNYQYKVMQQRIDALEGYSSYITDRSFVDMMAYVTYELGGQLTEKFMDIFYKECKWNMRNVTTLVFLDWNDDVVLENNGRRVLNKYFQSMMSHIIHWVIYETDIVHPSTGVLHIKEWDFEKRKKIVIQCLK